MLEEIESYAQRGESFAFESTLAGLGYLPMTEPAQSDTTNPSLSRAARP
jgi:hypothetical protein